MAVIKTTTGYNLPEEMFEKYLGVLINQFFKILPIRENGEPSLKKYIKSLQIELIGNERLISALNNDPMFLSLISTLQYMLDNDCDVPTTKQEVFKAIDICKKLQSKYIKERE